LKWVWLTHDDADHIGSLKKILEAAPKARLAANSLAVMRSCTAWPIPMDRVQWLNSGDILKAGDRELTAVRPPIFDNPTTLGIYDKKSKALFSADFFGAIIPSPAKNAEDIEETDLSQGMISWASADSPWVHMADAGKFRKALDRIRQFKPKMICSAHLPPARGDVDRLLGFLEHLPTLTPFVTPDQSFLEKMLLEMRLPGSKSPQ
jgi:flavorubredoxin